MLSFVVEIVDCVAVSQHNSVKVPFSSEAIDEKTVACTARDAFVSILSSSLDILRTRQYVCSP